MTRHRHARYVPGWLATNRFLRRALAAHEGRARRDLAEFLALQEALWDEGTRRMQAEQALAAVTVERDDLATAMTALRARATFLEGRVGGLMAARDSEHAEVARVTDLLHAAIGERDRLRGAVELYQNRRDADPHSERP